MLSTSLFQPTCLSVHTSVCPSVRHKIFFCLNCLRITPWLLGWPLGLTLGSPGSRSPSIGARICPKSSHFLVFEKVLLFLKYWGGYVHEPLALDRRVVQKISKCHFFQDIKNSFHGVTQIGLKPHQNFFQFFFSTNTVARGVQSFCILEGATCLLIEQWPKFFNQFSQDMC